MKKEKGFTLIELSFVVIVLGILATMTIPRFTKQTKQFTDFEKRLEPVSIESF